MHRFGIAARALLAAGFFFGSLQPTFAGSDGDVQVVSGGGGLDYQPSVIRSTDDGARIVVFERLDPATLSGDLWLTRSNDEGASWSAPAMIVASAANERHPALLQLGPSRYALFYLKGETSTSSFRLWRATSSDGVSFTEQGALDLGWASGGEVNPHVIRHADGTLTMSYQRLGSNAAYVAQSGDDGVSWDGQQTQVSANAALPRIAYRESDGRYLASYQRGSSGVHILVKTTTDVRDWSVSEQNFALEVNNHDSLPVVMPGGAFALFWIVESGNGFDLRVRRSLDGVQWEPSIDLTDSPDENDVEPHPLVGSAADSVELYWGREVEGSADGFDIVRRRAVSVIADRVFADPFESAG